MISRFDWSLGRLPALGRRRNASGLRWLTGRRLIAGLTFLFILWLGYRLLIQPSWPRQLPDLLGELLSLVETASAFTLAFLWVGLWWRGRREKRPSRNAALTVDDLYALSPRAFERYVGGLFQQKGYRVRLRGGSGDAGVDLELVSPIGRRAIVQCKRYRTTIGPEIVRELFGTMIHEGVRHAFLVTTAEISDAARAWASNKPMTLIDGPTLVQIADSLAHDERKRGV